MDQRRLNKEHTAQFRIRLRFQVSKRTIRAPPRKYQYLLLEHCVYFSVYFLFQGELFKSASGYVAIFLLISLLYKKHIIVNMTK